MKTYRIGMVGLDTSHVPAFASLLHDATHEYHVPGARIVAAFPGGSPDFDLSANRVGPFTDELRDKRGVVTGVDASVYAPSFGGLLAVSALAPEETLLAAVQGITEGVTRLALVEPITAAERSAPCLRAKSMAKP